MYELNGEDSRTLAVVGAFRVVPEHDLDADHVTLEHLRDVGLVESVDLGDGERGLTLTREGRDLGRVQVRVVVQLALPADARQVEVAHESVARVQVVAVTVLVHSRAATAAFTVACVISRIEHGCPPDMALRWVVREGARAVTARGRFRKALSVRGDVSRGVQSWSEGTRARGRRGDRAMGSARVH